MRSHRSLSKRPIQSPSPLLVFRFELLLVTCLLCHSVNFPASWAVCLNLCVKERGKRGRGEIPLHCRWKGLAQILTIIGTTLLHCAVGTGSRYTGRTIVVISHRQSSANARVRNPRVGTYPANKMLFFSGLFCSPLLDVLDLLVDARRTRASCLAEKSSLDEPQGHVITLMLSLKATWSARRSWRHFGASGTWLLVVCK